MLLCDVPMFEFELGFFLLWNSFYLFGSKDKSEVKTLDSKRLEREVKTGDA